MHLTKDGGEYTEVEWLSVYLLKRKGGEYAWWAGRVVVGAKFIYAGFI